MGDRYRSDRFIRDHPAGPPSSGASLADIRSGHDTTRTNASLQETCFSWDFMFDNILTNKTYRLPPSLQDPTPGMIRAAPGPPRSGPASAGRGRQRGPTPPRRESPPAREPFGPPPGILVGSGVDVDRLATTSRAIPSSGFGRAPRAQLGRMNLRLVEEAVELVVGLQERPDPLGSPLELSLELCGLAGHHMFPHAHVGATPSRPPGLPLAVCRPG